MAEEVLKYKVEIDSSDVAEQLQSIRNQVDLAMGSLAAQQVKPTTFDKVAETFSPANIGGVADAFRQKFEKDTSQTLSTMTQMLDRTGERMQLGFGRFTGDLRRLGLLSDPTQPERGAGLPGQVGLPGSMSFGRGLAASLGIGFDPTSPFTSTDFMLAGGQRVSRGFERFTSDFGITAIGAAIGSVGGVPGAAIGGLVGMGVQAGVDLLTSSAQDVMSYGRGLQELGAGQVRGISSTDGRVEPFFQAQAESLFDFTRTLGARRAGLSMEEISAQIVDFGGAGGFRGMTPSQFSETLFQLPSAVRLLSQGANLDQSAAASMIGSMVNMGLADNVLGASTQALTTTNLGGLVGMSPDQIFGAGLSAVTATGGMGIAPSDAFRLGTQSTALTAQAVLQNNPDAIALSNRLGGPQQAGFAMLENGLRQMMSPLGLARTANIQGGGSEGAGMMESMMGAANFFTQNPGNIFSAIANQGSIVGGMNTLTIQNAPVQNAVDMLQSMGFTNAQGQANSDEIIGLMMSLDPSLTRDQAGVAVFQASQGSGPLVSQSVLSARESLIDVNRMNAVSPIGSLVSSITQPFVNTFDQTFGRMGRGLMGGINSITESIGDSINQLLTGVSIQRRDPVLNESVTSLVSGLMGGNSELLNSIVGDVTVDRNEATRLDARAQSNRFFKANGEPDFIDSENGMLIFDRLTYGKSDADRQKVQQFLEREKRMGRLDDLDLEDVMAFDAAMGEFHIASGNLDVQGREDAASIKKAINLSMGTDDATRNAAIRKLSGLSDIDILNQFAGSLGFDSFGDASDAAKVAIVRQLQDVRNLDSEDGFIGLNRGLSNLTPTLSTDEARQAMAGLQGREALNSKMPEIRKIQDRVSGAVTSALTTAGGEPTQEFFDSVKREFGIEGNIDASTIGDIVAGKRTDLPSISKIISKLEASGSEADLETAGILRRMTTLGDSAGLNETIQIGKTSISIGKAIDLENAFEIQDEVIKDVNSFVSALDPDIAGDSQVLETIERISLNERLAGKDKETVKTQLDTKIGRILEHNKRTQLTGINERLRATINAEALLDADSLAESIDFQSRFAGLDSKIQEAAMAGMQEEFFITGARVNKKLENALTGDGDSTFLKVKEMN